MLLPGVHARPRPARLHAAMLLLFALAQPAGASLDDAHAAWRNSQYERAVTLFRRYARLGSPVARYNLAMALLAGRGVPRDVPEGYAWLDLAAAQGDAQSATRRDRVLAELVTDEAAARARAAQLRERYGPAALAARLDPVPRPDAGDAPRFRWPRGPVGTLLERTFPLPCEGSMYFDFTVDARGRVHDVAGRAFPLDGADNVACVDGRFAITAARVQTLRFDSGPGGVGGGAFVFQLQLSSYGRDRSFRLSSPVGDLARARDGNGPAQFALALQLLSGFGVQRDEAKADRWLRLAEAEGVRQVHLVHGILALRAGDSRAAAAAFRKGDAAGDIAARRRLAWLAATSADPEARDPALALALVARLPYRALDLEAYDIRAAALARAGRFAEAVEVLQAALAQVDYGGDHDDVRLRLVGYRRGEPYTEDDNPWRAPAPGP
jgi:TPR repeat protein